MVGETPPQQCRILKGVTIPLVVGGLLYSSRTLGCCRVTMRLMTPERWLDRYFEEGSRPSMQVLQRLLREGKLPGRKVGGAWYIDEHEWLANGDDLVLRVLSSS